MRERQRHGVGRPRVGPFPKLSQIRCFYGFPMFRHARTPCRCRCRGGRDTPMGGGDGGTNGCAVGGELSSVSGPQKPEISSIWVEKRLRNGWETAGETTECWPTIVGIRIAIGPGIEEVEPCPWQGAPRAVFSDALP